jgi:SWI/SNF-related matrix-associated actin-dependent regulator of chromatin subfamily A member 5
MADDEAGPSDAGGVRAVRKTVDREAAFVEQQRLDALRRERRQKLDKLKEAQGASGPVDTIESRLQLLMRQLDVYAGAMDGPAAGAGADAAAGETGRRKKGRMTEKQEDALMLQNADGSEIHAPGTRLTVQPKSVSGEMRAYQLEGLNWLVRLFDNGVNGILADEMGLGKTLQTLSLLSYLKHNRSFGGPHLVIVPKSTIGNWGRECARWTPEMTAFKFEGDKAEREALRTTTLAGGNWDICITTYETVISEKAAIKKIKWSYLIIDEAHRIKNESSVLSQVVRVFETSNRLLITGTPLQNNLHELWAMLNFLLPDLFSDASDFDAWFNLEGKTNLASDGFVGKLHKILRPFLLRRLKADVEKALLPKKEVKLFVGMSEMQTTWYRNILSKNIDALNSTANRVRMLNILMQLRKCVNHPYLFEGAEQPPFTNDGRLVANSGKLVLLDKLLPRLKKDGHRVLIFSQMTRMLDILEDYCFWKEHDYCRIDGSTNGEVRESAMEEFNAPDSSKFIFLLSTRAGGLGINLATADTVILYDSDWNPQMDLQAQDRAHRIGQKKRVVCYRFVTEGTVEEKIVERAQKKLYLDAVVIQQGRLAEQDKQLDKSALQSMIRFGADAIFNGTGAVRDEDLDALLQYGETRTQEEHQRLQTTVTSLANFSLTAGDAEKSLYDYAGEDFSLELAPDGADSLQFINLPKRDRKANYDVDGEFARQMNKAPAEARVKGQKLLDFQLFDVPRIEELRAKEALALEGRASARKARAGGGGDDDDGGAGAGSGLTRLEELEKAELLRAGFGDWSRKDFNAFVRGCELHGRDNVRAVAAEIEGKTEHEVARYASSFFRKYEQIENHEKLLRRIETGEARIQRRIEIGLALASKVARHRSPWQTLRVAYGAQKGRIFTEDEDRFLVCMTHHLGYGRWDELRDEVRKCWTFRFDWFIKTRSTQELQRRVDLLIRLIEKENAELAEADAAKRSKEGGSAKKVRARARDPATCETRDATARLPRSPRPKARCPHCPSRTRVRDAWRSQRRPPRPRSASPTPAVQGRRRRRNVELHASSVARGSLRR